MTRSRILRPALFVLLVLGGATAAWAARPTADDDDDAPPATVPIQIRLTGAGLQVTPARVTVNRGDEIVWSSDLPFAVDVARNAELFGRILPPAALRGRANAPARAQTGGERTGGVLQVLRGRVGWHERVGAGPGDHHQPQLTGSAASQPSRTSAWNRGSSRSGVHHQSLAM